MNSEAIDDCKQSPRLGSELGNFSIGKGWEIFITFKLLAFFICIGAIQRIKERSSVGERYQLQLRLGLLLLVLKRLRRLLFINLLINIFIKELLLRLSMRVSFVDFFLRRLVLILVRIELFWLILTLSRITKTSLSLFVHSSLINFYKFSKPTHLNISWIQR